MNPALIRMLTAAGVVSVAATSAPVINRFRNAPAAGCALLGAVLPWADLAVLYRWPTFRVPVLLSLAFTASSFLHAILFYTVEERGAQRVTALAAILVAAGAAIYFGVLIGYALLVAGL